MGDYFEKVLMIGPEGKKGGIGSVINTYIKCYPGIKFISSYPESKTISRSIHFLKCIWKMNQLLRRDKDIIIVHFHVASNGSFIRKSILLFFAKLKGKSTVFHIHAGGFKEFYGHSIVKQMIIKGIMRSSDAVIALSKEWEDYFKNSLKLKNVCLIGNPVEIKPSKPTMKLHSTINLLFLGKICNEKGIFELVKFLSNDHAYLKGKITLTIAGFGEIDQLLKTIDLYDTQNNIRFIGWVEGMKKIETICESDIFILPSHFEGLPVSIIECMMCSKPIIATKVGGVPTLVENGYNGWIIDPGNMEALHPIFDEILANQTLLKVYGKNACIRGKEFNSEKIKEKILHVYQSIQTTD